MTDWVNTEMIALMLSSFVLLGSSELKACIRVMAIQGILTGFLPLLTATNASLWHTLLLVMGAITIKGVIFPWLLGRALREVDVRQEMSPYVGYTSSLLLGIVLLAMSFWIASHLPSPSTDASSLVVPVTFFNAFVGLFIIVSRRKALMQVLGYLALENGIYVFGVALVQKQPTLIELGTLLDIFVAVFVMTIMILHISQEFEHMDVDRMATLKDTAERLRKRK